MGLMRCELCAAYLDEETMVGAGEFFVCPDCADREARVLDAVDDKVVEADLETKH